MSIALTLEEYLDSNGVSYDVVTHPYAACSMKTAEAAHIPGRKLAKSVILEDEKGYLMAVIPATHRIELGALQHQLKRRLRLAAEPELSSLFHDCTIGAVPALGTAYGIETVVDDCLNDTQDIYFEAGSHTELVHVSQDTFNNLFKEVHHGRFSYHQ